MVVTKLVLSYNRLKLKLRVFLAGHRVAMVTYYAIIITIIGSKMAERLRDTNIVASLDKFKSYSSVKVKLLEKCWMYEYINCICKS